METTRIPFLDDWDGSHRGAIFTVELGELVQSGFDLGLDKYPIFDDDYREPLNFKIVDHFWFREIGLETPELFKRFLNRRMNEIMPYYNQLYRSQLLELEPLLNYKLDLDNEASTTMQSKTNFESGDHTATKATAESETSSDSKSRAMASTFPQMQLSGREDYASSGNDSQSATTGSSSAENLGSSDTHSVSDTDYASNGTERYLRKYRGLTGLTQSRALMEWRETFINIDMMVINDLNDLFMGIYTDYWNAL